MSMEEYFDKFIFVNKEHYAEMVRNALLSPYLPEYKRRKKKEEKENGH